MLTRDGGVLHEKLNIVSSAAVEDQDAAIEVLKKFEAFQGMFLY